MTLAEYVQAEAAKPFALGAADCAHFVAGWVEVRTGRDGLAVFAGLPEATARDLTARRRLLRSMFEGCRSIGLQRVRDPLPGDVATIRTAGFHRCAIRSGRGWLFRDAWGLNDVPATSAKLLMAWSVP